MPCRIWAERLRFWVREHVVGTLLSRMADISKRALSRQQCMPVGLVLTTLPPAIGQCENLQLPKEEELLKGVSVTRQAMQQAQQASAAPAAAVGMFGAAAANAQQPQEQAARVKAMQLVHKVCVCV